MRSTIPSVRGRIAVCMPTTHTRAVPIPWLLLADSLQSPLPYQILLHGGYDVADNREHLAQRALEGGFDWLLWWDDDIHPPVDAIPRMLAWHYPLVSGCYRTRHDLPAAGMLGEWEGELGCIHPPLPPAGRGVWVDAVGLGFCLMDARVVAAIPPRRFAMTDTLGEDFYFFWQVKQRLGIPVLLDGDIALGHERVVQVAPDGGHLPLTEVVRPEAVRP